MTEYDEKYITTSREMSIEQLKKKNEDVAMRYYGKDIDGIYPLPEQPKQED